MTAEGFDLDSFTAFGEGSASAWSSPYDLTASASSVGSVSNMGTVSPQDLLLQEPFMSAPNSTAFTDLTSPSLYNGSPEINSDSYDVSPNFGSADFDAAAGDVWFPLFPQSETAAPQQPAAVAATPALVEDSPASTTDELDLVEPSAAHQRRKSGTSPPASRHSSVSGVNSRRRDKPLPPIIVEDPSDTTAMKRARNTLAARKSRERKAQRFEELEEKIAKLEAERDHYKKLYLERCSA